MTQISILGCGWLGLPLARTLLENEFLVNGSTTTQEKLSTLKKLGIQSFLLLLQGKGISGDVQNFLKGSKTLIINIPPKLKNSKNENFVSKIKNLIPFIEKSTVENVLFISSTSVYGNDNSTVNEETIRSPKSKSGKQLIQIEQLLQNNSKFKTTILRFGGLIGEDRHPIYFLAGKTSLDNPDAPVNLIHQKDCIGIILEILRQAQNNKLIWNETFNAVAPFHPIRKEYYTQKALNLGLIPPEFNSKNPTFKKIISSAKVENVLGYTFKNNKL